MENRLCKFLKKHKTVFKFLLVIILFVVVFFFAVLFGRYNISFKTFFKMMASPDNYKIEKSIVLNLRLPRTIMAALVGISLSLSALLYQETFQNKLVSPDILGVSSGAAVGAAIAIIIGLSAIFVSVFAFLFGIVTVIITISISNIFKNRTPISLVLAGIIIGGLMSSILAFIKYLADADTTLASIVFWLLGSFANAKMSEIYILLPIVFICTLICLIFSWRINIIALGKEEAQTKGLNYHMYRGAIIVIATILTASSVAFSGTIGWIGLVIPHIARISVGRNTTKTVPFTIVLGGIFMVLADVLSRTFTASEIPISAITGFFGTIAFISMLILRSDKHGNN